MSIITVSEQNKATRHGKKNPKNNSVSHIQLGGILSLSSRSCGSCSDNTASSGSRRLALRAGSSQNALDLGKHFDNSLSLSIGLWHVLRWLGGGAHDAVGWRAGDGSGCLSR